MCVYCVSGENSFGRPCTVCQSGRVLAEIHEFLGGPSGRLPKGKVEASLVREAFDHEGGEVGHLAWVADLNLADADDWNDVEL